MENALLIYSYGSKQVRTIEKDGDIWFVAKDVCDILEIQNHKDAIKSLDDDEKSGVDITDPHGRVQVTNVITESGVYALVFRSRKPEAKKFSRWVRREVLPSIRRMGAFVSDQALTNPEFVNGLMERITAVQEANDELREQIARDQAATTFGKIMLGMQKGLDFHKAAQLLAQQGLPIGRNRLYKLARDIKWLCEQKKIKNHPTQAGIKKGVVGWQSEIIDGHIAEVVVLSNKGFDQILQKLLKEHRPIIYLIDREEAQDRALEAKKAGKQKALA